MAMTEDERHALHDALRGAIGASPASTLMSAIPPVGWADIATKHDLAQLEMRMDLRFDAVKFELRTELRTELGALRAEMYDGFGRVDRRIADVQQKLFLGLIGTQIAFAGVVVAAIAITG